MKSFARSFAIHAVIIALAILFGATAHKVVPTPVRYQQTLILPMDMPVPAVRPVRLLSSQAAAPVSVARLAPGAKSTLLAASVETQQPRLVTLSTPATIELPLTPVRVTEAPQATLGMFSASSGAVSGRSVGSVSTGGFGSAPGSGKGSGRGEARVVEAAFSIAPEPAPGPRAVITSIAQLPSVPVIISEPRPVYPDAARAAGIQGSVDIRVKFKTDGSVEVLEVVSGLPGLNESALAVAKGIRFRPAASDFTTLIHVRFELS